MNDNPGKGDDEKQNSTEYVIDETIELEDFGGHKGYIWDIDEDIDPESEYVVRAISRDSGSIQVEILPEEEAEALEAGENYWPEWTSRSGDKISQVAKVDLDDEDPYYHSGDLKLAVVRTSTDAERVTMKFREAE